MQIAVAPREHLLAALVRLLSSLVYSPRQAPWRIQLGTGHDDHRHKRLVGFLLTSRWSLRTWCAEGAWELHRLDAKRDRQFGERIGGGCSLTCEDGSSFASSVRQLSDVVEDGTQGIAWFASADRKDVGPAWLERDGQPQ